MSRNTPRHPVLSFSRLRSSFRRPASSSRRPASSFSHPASSFSHPASSFSHPALDAGSMLPLLYRIAISVVVYFAVPVVIYGLGSFSEHPMVLLWPLAAVTETLLLFGSITHWTVDLVVDGVGALALLCVAVSTVLFLLGRIPLIRLLAIALGLIFVYAAVPKILEVDHFARDVRNYRILPVWSHHIVALWLPWMELLAGICIVSGMWKRAGTIVILGLLSVFSAGLISAVVRGLDIDCGCYGNTVTELARAHRVGLARILENFAMMVVALLVLTRSHLSSRASP
jgi:uncharacterized membrane protein YphA (DoxX/SURF4 family)